MQATTRYIALLRGVNVGGNAKIKMNELREALVDAGLTGVSTYIQSGNVLFSSHIIGSSTLATVIHDTIANSFKLDVDVVIFDSPAWANIINSAPSWWGVDSSRKHNLLVLLKPYNMVEIMDDIGVLKPDIEAAEAGKGVVYQSVSKELFGKTTTGKLASKPVYKRITVRNYNTATKLLELLEQPKS